MCIKKAWNSAKEALADIKIALKERKHYTKQIGKENMPEKVLQEKIWSLQDRLWEDEEAYEGHMTTIFCNTCGRCAKTGNYFKTDDENCYFNAVRKPQIKTTEPCEVKRLVCE